jgi:nitrogen fixation protein NifX
MKPTRIAVVSTDGLHVNDHFGKANRFLIYKLVAPMALVEERPAVPLSVDDPNHAFDQDKFDRTVALLHDCTKVYVTRIGKTPAAKLKDAGIEPIVYAGAIADIT